MLPPEWYGCVSSIAMGRPMSNRNHGAPSARHQLRSPPVSEATPCGSRLGDVLSATPGYYRPTAETLWVRPMRAKARFLGDGAWSSPPDFSSQLRAKLRSYFPASDAAADYAFSHPADTFVEEILGAARPALEAMWDQQRRVSKEDVRAELAALKRSVGTTRESLRSLSPAVDRSLGQSADPLGCADKLDDLSQHIDAALADVDHTNTRASRPNSKRKSTISDVRTWMAVDVLRCLVDYGIQPLVTGDEDYIEFSPAIQILHAIGYDIGIRLQLATWKRVVVEARAQAPDLKERLTPH